MCATIGSDLVAKKYDIMNFNCVTVSLQLGLLSSLILNVGYNIKEEKENLRIFLVITSYGKRNKVHMETFHLHFKQHRIVSWLFFLQLF